ncbi:glutaredoxin 3 [Pseudochrobactrum sp. HB0163]|uniref:glutaredoxin 3 n=1 Tax=Pseudochrobactrum sp. HB0163 TaxID=3450708 RepID=UPI003F6DA9CD
MKVEIYTRDGCGYCMRAKKLLDERAPGYTEYNATLKPEYRAEMMSRSGGTTFPQIFIGDVHVGGCDDLYALERAGKLQILLETGKLG